MRIQNRLLSLAMVLCILFSLCAPMRAEVTEETDIQVNFTMLSQPKYTYEMTAESIKAFFENETRQTIFAPSRTTSEIGVMTVNGNYQIRDISVLTFKITDAASFIKDDPQKDLEAMMSDIFTSVTESMMKKQISTCIYTYACDMKSETVNGETNIYLNLAFYMGDNVDKLDSQVVNGFVRPVIEEWADLTDVEKIMMLNAFILSGQFSYDTDKEIRKSTVEFINDKEGVCEEYAGLTALFLDEMGIENIVVVGQAKDSSGEMIPHSWNMVKLDGQWYHLDILWDGPIDAEGQHTAINDNYLLKSTQTFAADHIADKMYLEYTKLATKDYVKSEEEEDFDPGRPGLTELEDAKYTLAERLNEAYDIISNHAEEYTQEAIKNLNSIYSDAYYVYIDEEATLTEIKTVQAMLNTAMSSLTKADEVNKDNLFYTLGQAYEMLFYTDVAALYPASALRELEKVYNSAVKVYQNEDATQNQVNSANWTLWSKVQEIKDSIKEPEVVEPVEPVDPEPVVPDVPVDPEPSEPVDPEPTEPVEPVDPEPTEPVDPIDPEPVEPVVPVDPIAPVDPVEPNEPVEPVNPIIPGEEPVDEKKIPTDIIIYALLAVAAAGGIAFLIIDGIRKRKNNEEETEAEDTLVSEENIEESTENKEKNPTEETSENKENESPADNSAETAAEIAAVVAAEEIKEENPEEPEKEESENGEKAAEPAISEAKEESVTEDVPMVVSAETEEKKNEEIPAEATEEKTEEQTENSEVSEEVKEETPAEPEEEAKEEPSAEPEETTEEKASEPEVEVTVIPAVETEETSEEPEARSLEEVWEEKPAEDILEKPEETSKEEELSVVQIQEDIEANRKAAVNILKQIKKRKKEIKNNEKE